MTNNILSKEKRLFMAQLLFLMIMFFSLQVRSRHSGRSRKQQIAHTYFIVRVNQLMAAVNQYSINREYACFFFFINLMLRLYNIEKI